MKKSSAVLFTEERSMASGGRLSQCRLLGKYFKMKSDRKSINFRFSGQKSGTRMILRVLQSFYIFFKL